MMKFALISAFGVLTAANQRCVNCWVEKATIHIQKENIVFRSLIPQPIVKEIRYTELPVVEESVVGGVFGRIVQDMSKSVASHFAFGNLVNVEHVPVGVYDRLGQQVFRQVDLSNVVAVSIDGKKQDTIQPKNSEWFFKLNDKTWNGQRLDVLNFPKVEIVLEGKMMPQPVTVNLGNTFAADFFANKEVLISGNAKKLSTDFDWVTLVFEEAKKAKIEKPKVVKQEVGFVVSALDQLYKFGGMTPVHVSHPMDTFWVEFQKKEKLTKEQVAMNLQQNYGLSFNEKRIIAKDYAEGLIEKKAFEEAVVTLERYILQLEFLYPAVSKLNLSGKGRSAAAQLFLHYYGKNVCSYFVEMENYCIIADERQLDEDFVVTFLTGQQPQIFAFASKGEMARRHSAEVGSWEAVFPRNAQVLSLDLQLEVALRQERAEVLRQRQLDDMVVRIEAERRKKEMAKFVADQQAILDHINYERMWNEVRAVREHDAYHFYGEEAYEEPAMTAEEAEIFAYWDRVNAHKEKPCGLQHRDQIAFAHIARSYRRCDHKPVYLARESVKPAGKSLRVTFNL